VEERRPIGRLIVGQNVYSLRHRRAAQLIGFTERSRACVVRFPETGEVVTVSASDLRVASWSELRVTSESQRVEISMLKKITHPPEEAAN
jgi:hypothetical protein